MRRSVARRAFALFDRISAPHASSAFSWSVRIVRRLFAARRQGSLVGRGSVCSWAGKMIQILGPALPEGSWEVPEAEALRRAASKARGEDGRTRTEVADSPHGSLANNSCGHGVERPCWSLGGSTGRRIFRRPGPPTLLRRRTSGPVLSDRSGGRFWPVRWRWSRGHR